MAFCPGMARQPVTRKWLDLSFKSCFSAKFFNRRESWLPKLPPTWLVSASYSLWMLFLNKISLDWLLTLKTLPSTSKLSDNPGEWVKSMFNVFYVTEIFRNLILELSVIVTCIISKRTLLITLLVSAFLSLQEASIDYFFISLNFIRLLRVVITPSIMSESTSC